jgi:hypothetical protein
MEPVTTAIAVVGAVVSLASAMQALRLRRREDAQAERREVAEKAESTATA